jgi:hypothetical protein
VQPERFVEQVQEAVGDIVRKTQQRHGSVSVDFNVDVMQREDDNLGYVVTEPTGPVTVTIRPGLTSDSEFVPRPPKPAAHPKTLGQFCEHLEKHRPFAAKIIDSGVGAMLVYCDAVNVYFRNTQHALRALRHYGVTP